MAQIHALTPEGRLPTAAVAHAKELIGDDIGARTVSIDVNGDPYLDPATGTHFILSDASGTPYISRSITPTFTIS